MRTITFQIAVGLVLALTAVPAWAQDNASGGLVAVLDVAKVFESNTDFQSKMERIKAEAETLKAEITTKQNAIRDEAQKVMQMPEGTPDRNAREVELEQRQAKLRTEALQIESDLLKREARIYYDSYLEMQTVVARKAQEYGITLVLRFDSSEIDPEIRNDVVKGVNRAVVYHNRLDLTKIIIQEMGYTPVTREAAAPAGSPVK